MDLLSIFNLSGTGKFGNGGNFQYGLTNGVPRLTGQIKIGDTNIQIDPFKGGFLGGGGRPRVGHPPYPGQEPYTLEDWRAGGQGYGGYPQEYHGGYPAQGGSYGSAAPQPRSGGFFAGIIEAIQNLFGGGGRRNSDDQLVGRVPDGQPGGGAARGATTVQVDYSDMKASLGAVDDVKGMQTMLTSLGYGQGNSSSRAKNPNTGQPIGYSAVDGQLGYGTTVAFVDFALDRGIDPRGQGGMQRALLALENEAAGRAGNLTIEDVEAQRGFPTHAAPERKRGGRDG